MMRKDHTCAACVRTSDRNKPTELQQKSPAHHTYPPIKAAPPPAASPPSLTAPATRMMARSSTSLYPDDAASYNPPSSPSTLNQLTIIIII